MSMSIQNSLLKSEKTFKSIKDLTNLTIQKKLYWENFENFMGSKIAQKFMGPMKFIHDETSRGDHQGVVVESSFYITHKQGFLALFKSLEPYPVSDELYEQYSIGIQASNTSPFILCKSNKNLDPLLEDLEIAIKSNYSEAILVNEIFNFMADVLQDNL